MKTKVYGGQIICSLTAAVGEKEKIEIKTKKRSENKKPKFQRVRQAVLWNCHVFIDERTNPKAAGCLTAGHFKSKSGLHLIHRHPWSGHYSAAN